MLILYLSLFAWYLTSLLIMGVMITPKRRAAINLFLFFYMLLLQQISTDQIIRLDPHFLAAKQSLMFVKVPLWSKKPLPFFLQILKVCLLNTWLAKSWALIFIQRPFTLSVSFGFHGPPLLTFKTDRLDLRRLDPGKSDVRGSLA